MTDIDVIPQNPCYVSVKPNLAGFNSTTTKKKVDVGTKVKLHNQDVEYYVAEPFFWDPAHPVEFIVVQVSGFSPAVAGSSKNSFKPAADCTSSLYQLL
tara:strand:- start:71 stop:364 length:294 start_codon:yes stop_codon:yes gene_type:complete